MDLDKQRCLMQTFAALQLNYCPRAWMFHSRKLNNRINGIHKRALRLVDRDNKTTLKELLYKENSVTVHHKNLKLLATEIFKVRNDLGPDIIRE